MKQKEIEESINRVLDKRREKIYANIIISLFWFIILILLGSTIFYIGKFAYTDLIDSKMDKRACEIKLEGIVNNLESVNCYAIEDKYKINHGRGISCICFYQDGKDYFGKPSKNNYLKSKEFQIK